MKNLKGTWKPVRQEIGGRTILRPTYVNQTLEIRDSTYKIEADEDIEGLQEDEGKIYIQKNKIDFYGKQGNNKGRHITAIFKIEKDQLIICYNLGGIGYPDTYVTDGKPQYLLSVYKYAK